MFYDLEYQLWFFHYIYISIIYIYIPVISSKLGGGITLFVDGKHSSSVTNPYYNIYIHIHTQLYIYLVGGLEHFLFFHILGIVTPTDFHIFRGVAQPPTRYTYIGDIIIYNTYIYIYIIPDIYQIYIPHNIYSIIYTNNIYIYTCIYTIYIYIYIHTIYTYHIYIYMYT